MHSQTDVWFEKGVWLAVTHCLVLWFLLCIGISVLLLSCLAACWHDTGVLFSFILWGFHSDFKMGCDPPVHTVLGL